MSRIKTHKEITYEQAALVLGCSSRNVRRLIKRHGIEPIRKGYRTVRLPAGKIAVLKLNLVTTPTKN